MSYNPNQTYISPQREIDRLNAIINEHRSNFLHHLSKIRRAIEEIVCVLPPDDGVVLLSNDGPCTYDTVLEIQVYDHEHFSPLGDALIALHHMTDPARIESP